MVKMKTAAAKDILRTIGKEKKRFISIMLITALGVTMMTGLSAGCQDLRYSADRFFDSQELFDISIQSTLGLTEEDVEVLSGIEGVRKAEGGYSEIVYTQSGELNRTAEIKTLQPEGMNLPYVLEGRLPAKADEIAVTKSYVKDTGKAIGDSLTIEEMTKEDEEESLDFVHKEYVITGIVIDAMDINNADGSVAFRATPNADYTFFVLAEAVDSEVFTVAYLSLEGAGDLLCYTKEYEDKVAAVISYIEEEIKEQREQARYDKVLDEAHERIYDAEAKMNEAFAEVGEELADAEKEIADGWEEIKDGRQKINDGRQELVEKEQEAAGEIADARAEIEEGYRKLEEGEQELKEASQKLYQGNLQMAEGRAALEEKEKETLEQTAEGEAALSENRKKNTEAKTALAGKVEGIASAFGENWPAEVWNAYVAAVTQTIASMLGEQGGNMSFTMTDQEQEALLQEAMNTVSAARPDVVINFNQTFTVLAAADPTQDAQAFVSQMFQLAAATGMLEATDRLLNQASLTLAEQKAYAQGQFAAAWEEIAKGEAELADATAQIHEGKAELAENRQKLDEAVLELQENEEKAKQEFADARAKIKESEQELTRGEQELIRGEQELTDHRAEYEEEKAKAEDEIAKAKEEAEDLDMTQWYVQDRTSLSGYVNVDSDTTAIESLASVFTIVFLVIAILISLTTVTRMVEEERGLVGTYKALGFTDGEIRKKYVIYAFLASFAGGIWGDFCGFIVLPKILFLFFDIMYLFPHYLIRFNLNSGTVGMLLFMLGIVGAAIWACETELRQLPAQLMRPKAPRLGSKVFLERITPLWKRLSFLNKVTARNLFRYKKRMLMTILGIAGCTALVLFGFAIKDSVAELMPLQYNRVYKYDLLAAVQAEDNHKLLSYMDKSEEVENYLNIQVETVKLKNAEGNMEKVQIMVFPEGVDISPYVTLINRKGEGIVLPEKGIYLTENAAKSLKLEKGETAWMQNLDLIQVEVEIRDIVKNYLGNNIYMSQKAYEAALGEYSPNGVLANLSDTCEDQIGFSNTLSMENWILSSVSTEDLKVGFGAAFTLINIVVYVVLILAAGLAFVVLFTLANTNISERIRELATIKVLGFFDREVHLYVNKETILLTGIGILLGLPVGAAMSSALTDILDMPSIYFAVTIYPKSFWLSAGISLLFALMVQLLTDRTLDRVDPIEALKSVE